MSEAGRNFTRRSAAAATQEARTPQRRDISPSLPLGGTGAFPLELIDLSHHPDGELMCLCGRAVALQDRAALERVDLNFWPLPPYGITLMGLMGEIATLEPLTREGLNLKAMTLLGDESSELNRSSARYHLVAVIRDFLRMGIPA